MAEILQSNYIGDEHIGHTTSDRKLEEENAATCLRYKNLNPSKASLFKPGFEPTQHTRTCGTIAICFEVFTIIVCLGTYVIGSQGYLKVAAFDTFFTKSIGGFMVGVVVQIALVAPLKLGRKMSQIWFGRRLLKGGMKVRELITAWSLIYSNSYRGVEDVWRGLSPIAGFLLLLYLGEIIVLGTIGSLYYTVPIWNMKASGPMPYFTFPNVTPTTVDEAGFAMDCSQRAGVSVGRLLDPLVRQGILVPNSTYAQCDSTHCTASETVIVSSFTVPFTGRTAAPAPMMDWTDLKPGNIVKGKMTSLTATADCRPSKLNLTDYELYIDVDEGPAQYLYIFNPWAVTNPAMQTPQLQLLSLAAEQTDPYVAPNGQMYIGMMAYNFPESFAHMTWNPDVGGRNASSVICTIGIETGIANVEVLMEHLTPTRVARILSVTEMSPQTPYDMSPGTPGYLGAYFLGQTYGFFSCDISPCDFTGTTPPPFDMMTGFFDSTDDGHGFVLDYDTQMEKFTAALVKLTVSVMPVFLIPDADPLHDQSTLTVWSNDVVSIIYTTLACNLLLLTGSLSGVCLLILHILTGLWTRRGPNSKYWTTFGPTFWMTESVYALLQALHLTELVNPPSLTQVPPKTLKKALTNEYLIVGAIDSSGALSVDVKQK
ncbi:uncharacterized protein SPPG_03850 [Spizellomyces punctatus DAOM BR117]|uniref:Uncharacterized protein n=1 Tax=Spizellomyces punctatus (strain DAOM BR117) TaxID=645134 RepID=A0A0L0HIT2_SPIPD|nr:uncharacterized protein SPPG_03850 [Spizellomyces punctatus DAOM BR117]KND00734.1 hypothetical protein SPPG_03850 [Spizellomyces punctatus DAOM BR117]|eukprot:XP_016608773.1 hypothetical protein SPPG_03850 [Spizellomyces punctatus DAOM BR117]